MRKEKTLFFPIFVILLLLVGVYLFFSGQKHTAKSPAPGIAGCRSAYKMYALSYGSGSYSKKMMVSGNEDQKAPMEFILFAIVGAKKKILIDAGSENRALLRGFGVTNPRSPLLLLDELGIQPDAVTDIIITHAHWDHVGALSHFPKAKAWIQKKEFQYMASLGLNEQKQFINGYTYDDLKTLQKWKNEKRIALIGGDQEILPCIETYLAKDSHTPGSQFVSVNTANGVFVFAGDNAYLYDNIEKNVPINAAISKNNNLRAMKKMRDLASSSKFILPGHDPEIFQHFGRFHKNIVRIE